MSIKVPIAGSTIYDVPSNATHGIHTFVEGTRHCVGAVYVAVNDQIKKIWPDANPTTNPTVTYSTPGTYTITLGPGYYKFSMCAGGGGGAISYRSSGSSNAGGAVAGGGSGAYGYFELKINVQETFTFVVGSGGGGAAGGGTQTGSSGTLTSVSSNLRGTMATLNPGTGASAYWSSSQSKSAVAGSAGSYSTILSSHHFSSGSNGSSATSSATTTDWYGYGGNNPDPYYGDGGTAHFYGPGNTSGVYANGGQNGWVKIEPATQYIYTSPITTSITLQPGTYYFEIVGAGGGGIGAHGASAYGYANGGSAASGYGYFTVSQAGVYNVQVGTGGAANSGDAGTTATGNFTSGDGTASYIKRASDSFNVVTCGGGTGTTWHYDGSQSGGEYFTRTPQGGTYSTSLSNNYTLANGVNGTTSQPHGDYIVDLPNTLPTYFSVYGQGGFARRLTGITHQGGRGGDGMLKIYKYS